MPRPRFVAALFVEKDEAGSTNDDARALAASGAPHGAVVLARRQHAGRGRDGRAFRSPEGGLYMSVVVRPRAPPARWGLIPLAAGLAVVDALAAHGFPARLKWPNDVLLDDRKLGGILVESRLGDDAFAIVGIGVNVRAAPLPEATCLAEHGAPPEMLGMARDVRDALLRAVDAAADEPARLVQRIRDACATLGRDVVWEGGAGIAADIDEDGALLVERNGARVRVIAGDVRVREKR